MPDFTVSRSNPRLASEDGGEGPDCLGGGQSETWFSERGGYRHAEKGSQAGTMVMRAASAKVQMTGRQLVVD
jgi:hypothetical protein